MGFPSKGEHLTSSSVSNGLGSMFQSMALTDAPMYHHDNVYHLPPLIVCDKNASRHDTPEVTSESGLCEDFANLSATGIPGGFRFSSIDQSRDCFGHELHRKSSRNEMDQDFTLLLPDEDGDTALHNAIMQEDETHASHIISLATDIDCLDSANNLGQTPAHLAAITNASRTLRRLMCAGADITVQDREGNTPLHLACIHDHLEVAKQLLRPVCYAETLENKYDIPFRAIPQNTEVRNFGGLTCLHLSVLHSNSDIVRLLLEVQSDPNVGDSKSGRTALHMAAELGMLDVVVLLLSYRRTCVDVKNYAGYTPAQLAHSRGHRKVTAFLVRNGATFVFHCEEDDDSDDDCDIDMD